MIVYPDPNQNCFEIVSELMSDCMAVPMGDGSYSVDPDLMENHGRLAIFQSGPTLIVSLTPREASRFDNDAGVP
jgi:hypothetical protein